ncbi:MAG: TonB family protein [Chitinispirillaceae bacterium]|nr:TonB family protein [Chitinispirillaceae bacterium]
MHPFCRYLIVHSGSYSDRFITVHHSMGIMRQPLLIILFQLQLACFTATVLSQETAGDADFTIEISATPVATDSVPMDTLPRLDTEPQLKTFVKAEYPAALQKSGIQGSVRLVLLVSETGKIDSVGILKGFHPILDKNAAAAAKRFVFTPAIVAEEPVAVLLEYNYVFTLTETLAANDTSVNFSGTLLEKGTRAPIADATVIVTFEDTLSDTTLPVPFSTYLATICGYDGQSCDAGKIITTTDSLGEFSFRALPCCSVLVTCLIPGYERFWQREVIVEGSQLSVVYRPERSSYSEYEIVVYGKTEEKEVSRRQLSKMEVRSIPGVGGDAIRVVQALPGVGRPTMGNGDIIVRGSRPWDSGYFLDGLRIPQLYHLDGLKSVYNTEALETVNFYPGGTGVRHGGYTGGIIDIVPRKARTDRLHGFAELNGMDVNLSLEGPINDNISFLVAARRSFFGDVMSKAFEKLEEWGENLPMWILLFYWDYLARADIRINDAQHLSLSVFGSRDSVSFIFNQNRGGSREIESTADRLNTMRIFSMVTAGWKWDFSPSVSNNLQYGLTFNREHLSAFGLVKIDRDDLSHQIRDEVTLGAGDHLTLYPGIDLLFDPVDYSVLMPDATGVIHPDKIDNWLFGILGVYLFAEYRATEKLTLFPGIRFDYFPELSYNGSVLPEFGPYGEDAPVWRGSGEPSVRLSARYAINERHTAKAALGTYSQTPQPVGQVIHPTWGEPDMPATKASQYVVGYEWECTDLFSIDLQGYTNFQWDIPRFDTSATAAASGRSWYGDTRGRMFGFEVLMRYLDDKLFYGWISYTLSRSERKNPADRKWTLFQEDIPHYLQLVGGVHLPFNWDVGLRLQYATGKPQTPVIGRTLYENNQQFVPRYGEPYSERTDPYFTLGMRFDHLRVTKRLTYSAFIDLPDLLGTFYGSPEYYVYNYDYTEREPFTMIPMIMGGIRVQF